jgi:hypothetical protein
MPVKETPVSVDAANVQYLGTTMTTRATSGSSSSKFYIRDIFSLLAASQQENGVPLVQTHKRQHGSVQKLDAAVQELIEVARIIHRAGSEVSGKIRVVIIWFEKIPYIVLLV